MVLKLGWLCLLTLALGALKIQYTFNQPYETRVTDSSLNSNHAVKPASGTNSVVNTLNGIFIKANSMITCPPNSLATTFPSSTSFTTTVLVRFIKIETSNQDRTFVLFKSGGTDYLKLYKDKSTNSDNSSKEFFATVKLSSSVTLTSSNLFPNSIWTLLAVTVSFTSPNSTVKLFVNNSQQATQTSAGSMPSPAGCSINGENTDAIYYEFRYYDSALTLTDMYGTVFKSGTTDCNSYSYACKANGDQLCNSDSYQVNESCGSCTSCGNFACYSTGCFSCPLEITDTACDVCFANSKANSDISACECSTGYHASSSSPLTCASCTVDSTSCNACYPNSELRSGACACSTSFYASSSSPLTCASCTFDSTSCNACYPNSELKSGACACLTGYFASSSSPLTCTSYASCEVDSTSCNACYPNSEQNSGACVCLNGFYVSSSSPLTCTSCTADSDACNACYPNSSLVSSACACLTGFYASSSSPLTCTSCTADSAACHACYPNSSLVGSACACSTGFYVSSSSPLTCTSCTSDSAACHACYPNSSLVISACACLTGFYASSSSPLTCTSCTADSAACHACYPNSSLVGSACACSTGFYASSNSPLTCTSCTVNSVACNACYPNSSLVSSVCACSNGFYASSNSPLTCTSCTANSVACNACYPNSSLVDSNCACSTGFYASSASPLTCSSCTFDSASCNACYAKSELISGACVCSAGFFASSASPLLCSKCASPCITCTGLTHCLTCTDPNASASFGICDCKTNYVDSGSVCQLCASETYYKGSQCLDCHADCATCQSYPTCLTCKDSSKVPSNTGCSDCSNGTYLQGSTCSACPTLCLTCSSSGCLSCVTNAELSGSVCACKPGFSQSGNACSKDSTKTLSFSLSVSKDNIITLAFNEPVTVTENGLSVTIEGIGAVSFTLEQVSATSWLLFLSSSINISNGDAIEVALTQDIPGYTLTNTSAPGILNAESNTSHTSEEQTAQAVGHSSQAAATTAVSLSTVLGFTTGSMTSAWGMINSIQIIGYIPMSHLDLPLVLSSFFQSVLDFNFIPNVFEYFVPDSSTAPPSSTKRIGISSSLFIMNAGQCLTTFLLFLTFWPVSVLLSKVQNHKIAGYFYDAAGSFHWNYFIRFFIEGFLELLIASAIQLYASSEISFIGLSNYAISLITILLAVTAPFASGIFVYKQQHRFADSTQSEFKKKWSSLFSEFKNDRGKVSSAFYVIFFTRRLFYVCIQFLLESSPLAQVILNVIHSALTATFLLVFKPFNESLINFSNIYSEFIITLTFSLTGAFLIDLNHSERFILQWVILGIVYSMMTVNFVISIFLTIRDFRELWSKWKRRRQDNKILQEAIDEQSNQLQPSNSLTFFYPAQQAQSESS